MERARDLQQRARELLDPDQGPKSPGSPPEVPNPSVQQRNGEEPPAGGAQDRPGFATPPLPDQRRPGGPSREAGDADGTNERSTQPDPWQPEAEDMGVGEAGARDPERQVGLLPPMDPSPGQAEGTLPQQWSGLVREARTSADRAIEAGRVPPRHRDLVRRVFGRYAQRTAENRGSPAAVPTPAPDSPER